MAVLAAWADPVMRSIWAVPGVWEAWALQAAPMEVALWAAPTEAALWAAQPEVARCEVLVVEALPADPAEAGPEKVSGHPLGPILVASQAAEGASLLAPQEWQGNQEHLVEVLP